MVYQVRRPVEPRRIYPIVIKVWRWPWGKTDRVWYYKMESDGFSLDDKREKIGDGLGDLPDIRKQWFAREKARKNDRKAKHFFVPIEEIEANKFDLSIGRYRETEHEEAQYEPPLVIMQRLRRWMTRSNARWMNWRRYSSEHYLDESPARRSRRDRLRSWSIPESPPTATCSTLVETTLSPGPASFST